MNESLQNAFTELMVTLNTKLSERREKEKVKSLEKAKTIANWVAAIAVPLVLGVSGYYVNLSLKGQETQSSMIALSIEILKETPQDSSESKSIRAWAIEVINYYSDVKIPKATQKVIIEKQPFLSKSRIQPSPSEYRKLFNTMVLMNDRHDIVNTLTKRIVAGRIHYEAVSEKTGIPWFFIGILHQLESGGKFDKHLHNGDPLNARTKHIPSGRPKKGNPPFTWEESAVDALRLRHLDKVSRWTLEEILYQFEKYNGMGYYRYHSEVKSPYLWGGSNHYTKGDYMNDGRWSDEEESRKIGAAVLLKFLLSAEDLELLISNGSN